MLLKISIIASGVTKFLQFMKEMFSETSEKKDVKGKEKHAKPKVDKRNKKKTKYVEGPGQTQEDSDVKQTTSVSFKDIKKSTPVVDKSSSPESKELQQEDENESGKKSTFHKTLNTVFHVKKEIPRENMEQQKRQLGKRMDMFMKNPQAILYEASAYDPSILLALSGKHFKQSMFLTTENEVKDFIAETLNVLGVEDEKANIFAAAIIDSDKKGHSFRGLASLQKLIMDITGKNTQKNSTPKVLSETGSTAWVDGNRALTPIVGKFCMDLAMAKALKTGLGIVSANNINSAVHGDWLTNLAKEQGFIAFVFRNARSKLCPVGSLKPFLGDNGVSYATPAGFDNFQVSFSSIALSKATLLAHVNNNDPLKHDFAYGTDGKVSRDPHEIYAVQHMLPLGLTTTLGSVKGYGLSIMIETLCGIMSGSKYGPFLKYEYELENETANYGSLFIAMDPNCFSPDFEINITKFLHEIKNLTPIEKRKPVIIPGELENHLQCLTEKCGRMLYPLSVVKATKVIAEKLHISQLKFKTLRI